MGFRPEVGAVRRHRVIIMGCSNYLFAEPSFLEGVARVFDPAGVLNTYNRMPSAQEADLAALRADWTAVGAQIAEAAAQFALHPRPESVGVEKK